jgi:hypothetical protein
VQALESLDGRKIAGWVDMKKIDVLLHQIRSGLEIDLADFDDFIVGYSIAFIPVHIAAALHIAVPVPVAVPGHIAIA